MALTPEEQLHITRQIRSMIAGSVLVDPRDGPATVATIIVLALCIELGIPREDIPATLERALHNWRSSAA